MATIDTNTAISAAIDSTLTDEQVVVNEQEVTSAAEGVDGGASGVPAEKAAEVAPDQSGGRAAPETRGKKTAGAGKETVAAKGDLVDPKSGRVIAKAGNERKYYEAAVSANGRLQQVVGTAKQMETQLRTYADAFTHLKNAGIEPNEVQAAISIYTKFKSDPAETIKDLLVVARQMGKNVDLGEGGQVDMAAIKGMIAEAMSPLTGAMQQRQQEGQLRSAAENTIRQFFTAYPDAQNQVDAINLVLQKAPRLGLEGAYFKVKALMAQRGLDWNTPLAVQLANGGNGGTPSKPLTTGRGSDGAVRVRGSAKQNGREQSTGDIVREALAEAGVVIP